MTEQEIIAQVEEANRPCVELATLISHWVAPEKENLAFGLFSTLEVVGQTVYIQKKDGQCFTVTVSLIDEADFWMDLHGVTPTLENGGAKSSE